MPPLRVVVVGAGSFGRNHLRVYRELQDTYPEAVKLVAVVDDNQGQLALAAHRFAVPGYASLDDLLRADLALDAASICVPTVHHASTAEQLLAVGIDTLIEKPFSASLDEADTILNLAENFHRIVQIGHLERFNPAVTATIARLNRPMFFEAHRLSVFTARSLDVDVVLDLMIHDLDIVLALTQSRVKEVRAVGLPVLSHKVDIANVRVEFDSGCVANFTASRISTEQVRKLRLFQPRQYLSLDFARQELLTIDVAGVSPEQFATLTLGKANAPHPSPGLMLEKIELEKTEPLRLEIEAFLDCVRTRATPRVSGRDGRAALALALEINTQISEHAARANLR